MKDRAIRSHTQLGVYQRAFGAAMQIFQLSKSFPKDERYSLTDQIRRSSRSVCAILAEAWRKRRYPAAFVAKRSDAEGEAAETQVWIEFAVKSEYIDAPTGRSLYEAYEGVIKTLVGMINHRDSWTLPKPPP